MWYRFQLCSLSPLDRDPPTWIFQHRGNKKFKRISGALSRDSQQQNHSHVMTEISMVYNYMCLIFQPRLSEMMLVKSLKERQPAAPALSLSRARGELMQ